MSRHQIKIVFFDAAGTLFEVRGRVGDAYSRVCRRFGADPDPDWIQSRFITRFHSQPPLAFPGNPTGQELKNLEYSWWKRLASEVFEGIEIRDFDAFFADLFEYFRRAEAWRLYPDVRECLDKIKGLGLTIAVISNFDSRLVDVINGLGIESYISAIHISSRIGAAKPDPRIFHVALDCHQLDPAEAIHIGDSLRDDVEGARSAGITAIWLDRHQSLNENAPCIRVNDLRELFEVVLV